MQYFLQNIPASNLEQPDIWSFHSKYKTVKSQLAATSVTLVHVGIKKSTFMPNALFPSKILLKYFQYRKNAKESWTYNK